MLAHAALSQSSQPIMGSRSQSLGYTSSCLKDEWSLFNNVSGLSDVKSLTTAFTYSMYPDVKFFNRMAATIAAPVKFGVIAGGVYKFGDDIYNEHVLNAGFANKFGIASLGVKASYIQYKAEGFGSKGVFSVSFGGIASLTKSLLIGAHISNINQPEISSKNDDERLPTKLTLGIALKPSEKVFLTSEIEKDLSMKPVFKTGLEYQFHKKFIARTGFNLNPDSGFIGFGFKPKRFSLDYALGYNINLGQNHQVSVAYSFTKAK